jgi:hypothetical protein
VDKNAKDKHSWITIGCFTFLMGRFVNWKLEILLAGDLDLIENGEWDTLDRVIA